MTTLRKIRDLLLAWGCPSAYAHDYTDRNIYWPSAAARRVSEAANWYPEMDYALLAMIDRGDADAIREWADLDVFIKIAQETGRCECDDNGPCDPCLRYASKVKVAMQSLADEIEMN